VCLKSFAVGRRRRALVPHGELGGELRAIARDDERAARDQRRLLNRMRADLQTTYPAALTVAGKDGATTVLRLLQRCPTQAELATATREELVTFALASKHGWPEPIRRPGHRCASHPSLPTRDYLMRAKAAGIRLAADQLLALHETRRGWEQRMAELLLGNRRTGRDHTVKDPDPGKAFPGGAIYLSFPGLGDRLAARVAGEIGEHVTQYESPNALQCYAGRAPITRRSGKSDYVVARRLAHNRYLGDAVHQWAF
jgi:Transposase IS116/IS110/IS902 family